MTTLEPALARDLNLHGLEANLTTIRKAAGATDEEVRDIIVAAVDSAMVNMRKLSALPLNERKQLTGDPPPSTTITPTATTDQVAAEATASVTETIKHRRRRRATETGPAATMNRRERRSLKGKSLHATRVMTCRGSSEGCTKTAFGNAIYRHEGACEHFARWKAKDRVAQRQREAVGAGTNKKKKAS